MAVLELSGNLMDKEAEQFRSRLHSLKESGVKNVVLDLGRVHLINSAGVGALVAGAKTLREVEGDLKLANLQDRTYHVLVVITRLGSVFNIFDQVNDAVASFHGSGS